MLDVSRGEWRAHKPLKSLSTPSWLWVMDMRLLVCLSVFNLNPRFQVPGIQHGSFPESTFTYHLLNELWIKGQVLRAIEVVGGRHICTIGDRAEKTWERQRDPTHFDSYVDISQRFGPAIWPNFHWKCGKNNPGFISHKHTSLKYN